MFYTIGHLEIPQRKILEKPLWYFDTNNHEGVQEIFKKFKKLTGYQYDNTHLKWSNIFGHLFSISVYYLANRRTDEQSWTISLWDHTGHTALITLYQKAIDKETDTLSSENYKKLCRATERFVNGYINCSGCKTEILRSEIAGSYFAGRYCTNCWESKYKAIEAKETYN